jgi:hypothetical protein
MKRIVSAAVIAVMAFATSAQAAFLDDFAYDHMLDEATPFDDVNVGHPNQRAVNFTYQEGIIEGYPDGTFKPDQGINRAELAKIMVYGSLDGQPDAEVYNNCFSDVTTEWYAPYVCYAQEQGWVQGYPDGTYKPAQNVNRVEALKIIMNVAIPEDEWPDPTDADFAVEMPADLDMNQWYSGYARMAIVKGLVDGQHVTQDEQGNVYYYPANDMSRKEVVEMLWRLTVWMVERMTYAEAMAELACFQQANPDLENASEQEQNAYVYEIFELYGFDQQAADEAIIKFDQDSVANRYIEEFATEKCGPGIEYDNWIRDTEIGG